MYKFPYCVRTSVILYIILNLFCICSKISFTNESFNQYTKGDNRYICYLDLKTQNKKREILDDIHRLLLNKKYQILDLEVINSLAYLVIPLQLINKSS
jgi:hypothetical protein